eukprot:CAMPEP_0114540304 /NCGR_PEP_ID=MMETSP0114-20121206/690_1 /TAXON_ID=31324 /ORGANISM="Goniomonas sp, Strain m" /LENGTH=346 /DNA_ID=CAMNT_0001724445 /DNA_START=17 /DNA_END=1057 /DNA_ORIENTATION=+
MATAAAEDPIDFVVCDVGLPSLPSDGKREPTKEEKKALKKEMASMKDMFDEGATMMKEANGTELKGDVICTGLPAALAGLKQLVTAEHQKASGAKENKWDFRYCPLSEFPGKTMDDLFVAYLKWSQKDKNKAAQTFNISKTLRRLDNYASWMAEHGPELFASGPLGDAMPLARVAMDGFVCLGNENVVHWWIDLGKCDFTKLPPLEMLRATVWNIHAITFIPAVQENGIVFIEDLAYCGFRELMAAFPKEMKQKTDKLFQGASAIKMRKFIFLRAPWWMNFFMKLMKAILSKKLASRMVTYGEDYEALKREVGGAQWIPAGFGPAEIGGTFTGRDLMFDKVYGDRS